VFAVALQVRVTWFAAVQAETVKEEGGLGGEVGEQVNVSILSVFQFHEEGSFEFPTCTQA
jgi:hypothetical protein